MDRPDLYDSDILAWSEQQAAALRRLAYSRDLPNDLDLENVVQEIEGVGLSQLRAAESFIRQILVHIAKAVSQPEAPSFGHWLIEAIGWQNDLLGAFSPSMRQRIDMEVLWQRALRQAKPALAQYGGTLAESVIGPCPVTLDDLLTENFEFGDLIRRIAQRGP